MIPADNGYEAKFDFPEWEGSPRVSYLLATVPRSGSTYLSHLLWQTGCLGAPLEYLNFDPTGPYGHASESSVEQINLWQAALRGRTSPNGVFGLKGFPMQFAALHSSNQRLLGDVMRGIFPSRPASRVIWLHRRDTTAHAISYARAILSGVWRKEQEAMGRAEPEYSSIAIERATQLIEDAEGAWAAMLADLGITPLELWYEDVVADPSAAVEAVAAYLGVGLDPSAAIEVPEIGRQSQQGAKTWAERHSGA
ncbi:Stf0 family sulfotransferase [Altererythrobacter sp. Root672]|uniref:Stf0 family sulfotransferase n=1 Tax=Altererythrobacter sp. Root672 TaxID=1736584 RepID=UPI0006FDB045|nr:Stf0 family sulfotransferase [Altererythrobacter sp. Root672]KRA83371.1 hypothetical protein ASD76_04775 [Altererythrobacter sp. Root672]